MKIFQSVSSGAGVMALLMLLASPAWAQSEAGRILFSRGVVSIIGEQDSARGGSTGNVIYEGERVQTGRNGVAQLRLTDGSLIALRASSDYHIQRQGFDVEGDIYEQTGQLVAGWMRMVTGAIGKKYPGNVKQGTSVATIGIRGTTFQVIHIPEDGLPGYPDTQPGTYLMLEEGSVEISTDAGKRLLQPGDVIFVSSKDAPPQLAPDKKPLFLNVQDGDATYVDMEESEFSDFTNETLISTLLPTREFTNTTALGFANFPCCASDYKTLQDPTASFTTSGDGAGRTMTRLEYSPDGMYRLDAMSGAAPDSTGYRVLRDGSEINWGIWSKNNYTISETFDDGMTWIETEVPPNQDWHYMMASNVLDLALISSSLTGQATYNWVGGTNFMDGTGVTTSFGITGGTVVVDFGTANMAFDLATNLDGGNITGGSLTCTGGCGLADFYGFGIAVNNEAYFGNISGALVGDGSGIISAIELSSQTEEQFYGTAAFEGNPDPYIEPIGDPVPVP